MNTRARFNMSPIMHIALVFCIAISALNLCCTFYIFQTIWEVRAIKELLTNLSPEQLPETYVAARLQYGKVKDYKGLHLENPNKYDAMSTLRLKREVNESITKRVRKARKQRRCRRRNKTAVQPICCPCYRCTRTEDTSASTPYKTRTKRSRSTQENNQKEPLIAAQYVGATDTHLSEYEHINFLRPSKWVTDKSNPVFVDDETFTFRTSGIHLVFAQILYPRHSPMKIAEIVHHRNGSTVESFRCSTGLFISNAAKGIDRPQTCTVIGLVSTEKGDTLRVKNGNEFAKVDILTNSVYFGVVKLYAYRTPRKRCSTSEKNDED